MAKKKIPSYNELIDKVMILCPNAQFHEDSDGEIVIETGFAMKGDEDDPLEPLSEIDDDAEISDDDEDDDDDDDDDDEELD